MAEGAEFKRPTEVYFCLLVSLATSSVYSVSPCRPFFAVGASLSEPPPPPPETKCQPQPYISEQVNVIV